jgi:hypothetical protein
MYRSPLPLHSYRQYKDITTAYDKKWSLFFSGLSIYAMYLLQVVINSPMVLQDALVESISVLSSAAASYGLLTLYSISPPLLLLPVVAAIVVVHFMIVAYKKRQLRDGKLLWQHQSSDSKGTLDDDDDYILEDEISPEEENEKDYDEIGLFDNDLVEEDNNIIDITDYNIDSDSSRGSESVIEYRRPVRVFSQMESENEYFVSDSYSMASESESVALDVRRRVESESQSDLSYVEVRETVYVSSRSSSEMSQEDI